MVWKLTIESCAETQLEAVVKARHVLEKMLESQHGYTVGTVRGTATGEWEKLPCERAEDDTG